MCSGKGSEKIQSEKIIMTVPVPPKRPIMARHKINLNKGNNANANAAGGYFGSASGQFFNGNYGSYNSYNNYLMKQQAMGSENVDGVAANDNNNYVKNGALNKKVRITEAYKICRVRKCSKSFFCV